MPKLSLVTNSWMNSVTNFIFISLIHCVYQFPFLTVHVDDTDFHGGVVRGGIFSIFGGWGIKGKIFNILSSFIS